MKEYTYIFSLNYIIMNQISVKNLREKKFSMILDVRSKDEYDRGHIPGAKLYDMGDIEKWSKKLKKDKEYYLVCKSGVRSGFAYVMLEDMGFEKCYNVVGGTDAWIEEGYEIE